MDLLLNGVTVDTMQLNGVTVTEMQFNGVKVWPAGGGIVVGDVFNTSIYTGNLTSQTIVSGVNSVGNDALIWFRLRDMARIYGMVDTVRGTGFRLSSDSSNAQTADATVVTSFNNDGFSVGASSLSNSNLGDQVAWTFRKAPKFFDVIEYTGDGIVGREIPHSLGSDAGLAIAKTTSGVDNWIAQHISTGGDKALFLNTNQAANTNSLWWDNTNMTSSTVTLGASANTNGVTYIMYVFAHDPSGFIQCGEFSASGGNVFVDLSWPESIQYIMAKPYDSTGDWEVFDTTRGITKELNPNLTAIETTTSRVVATAGGFTWVPNEAKNYIYMAIRAE